MRILDLDKNKVRKGKKCRKGGLPRGEHGVYRWRGCACMVKGLAFRLFRFCDFEVKSLGLSLSVAFHFFCSFHPLVSSIGTIGNLVYDPIPGP